MPPAKLRSPRHQPDRNIHKNRAGRSSTIPPAGIPKYLTRRKRISNHQYTAESNKLLDVLLRAWRFQVVVFFGLRLLVCQLGIESDARVHHAYLAETRPRLLEPVSASGPGCCVSAVAVSVL